MYVCMYARIYVHIYTRIRAGQFEVRVPIGAIYFSLHHTSRPVVGPASLGLFSWDKVPGRDVKRPPPSSADVKNEWSCPFAPLYTSMAWIGTVLLFLLS